jgi:hypothetical protein
MPARRWRAGIVDGGRARQGPQRACTSSRASTTAFAGVLEGESCGQVRDFERESQVIRDVHLG